MLDLNELCKVTLNNAELRNKNGGDVKTDTISMLKHTATEVVEAMEAYQKYTYAPYFEEGSSISDLSKKIGEHSKCFANELADIICCCLIISGKENIDIEKAVLNCIEKNRKRAEGVGDKL